MHSWLRFTAIEYSKPTAIPEQFLRGSGIKNGQIQNLVLSAAERVRRLLKLETLPISLTADRFQFQDFAGLLTLAPGLELEVAPKFLGNTSGWREDFFFLATLSHHGRLLDDEGLKSAAHPASDLGTLIGRSLVEMYWRNQRRPLRTYRHRREREFAIEGEFDAEDLLYPDEEGFRQQITSFTRSNPYNAVIGAAATELATVVPDIETRARLERLAQHLPRQVRPMQVEQRKLPSRSRPWQATYDLSCDIMRGLGGVYDPKDALAPGFVMQTWRAWEHLVSLALRMIFGGRKVSLQSRHRLGTRQQGSLTTDLCVIPDVIVVDDSTDPVRRVLVDAKYKGRIDANSFAISNADIYEALAFAGAAKIRDVILAYPCRLVGELSEDHMAGYVSEFSTIKVDGISIKAVELGVCGISKRGGLMRFANALAKII